MPRRRRMCLTDFVLIASSRSSFLYALAERRRTPAHTPTPPKVPTSSPVIGLSKCGAGSRSSPCELAKVGALRRPASAQESCMVDGLLGYPAEGDTSFGSRRAACGLRRDARANAKRAGNARRVLRPARALRALRCHPTGADTIPGVACLRPRVICADCIPVEESFEGVVDIRWIVVVLRACRNLAPHPVPTRQGSHSYRAVPAEKTWGGGVSVGKQAAASCAQPARKENGRGVFLHISNRLCALRLAERASACVTIGFSCCCFHHLSPPHSLLARVGMCPRKKRLRRGPLSSTAKARVRACVEIPSAGGESVQSSSSSSEWNAARALFGSPPPP
ncbi:hypothetical protein HPB50_016451 [Hyalomma asiaticum]|uniref:Uncharacterized protein n=1 Tax=Hyalomma asiaticum TaxID=266040 RepID=A0ACB7SN48_HYAAI|nr:hypothetical protein HPB50_016451 [Hyalomma asiaticum]